MLTCKEITELATDYVEGETPFGQRVSVWMHLAMCKACKRYVRQVTTLHQIASRLFSTADRVYLEELTPEAKARIESRIQAESDEDPPGGTRLSKN